MIYFFQLRQYFTYIIVSQELYVYYNKVEICGINTSKLGTLSSEEKKDLLIKTKNGNALARQELICGNFRLVLSIIQKFMSRCKSPDDLFQVGCVGLIKAIDNFDLSVGVEFSTYAVPMIIGEIRRYLRDNNMVRVSRSMRDMAYRALQAREVLSSDTSEEPTNESIASYLGVPVSEVNEALDSVIEPTSLYEPLYNDGDDSAYLMDQIKNSDENDDKWLEDIALTQALKKLSDRERKIVSMRFFRGKTQMEIAGEIGISQAQVSRIEKNALERIRKHL